MFVPRAGAVKKPGPTPQILGFPLINFALDIFLPSGMVGIVVSAMSIGSASITAPMCLPRSQPVFYSSRKFANPPPPPWLQQIFTWAFTPLSPAFTPIPSSWEARRCEPPRHFCLSLASASRFPLSKWQLILKVNSHSSPKAWISSPSLLCISLPLSCQMWRAKLRPVSLGNNCYLVNLVNVNQCLRTFAMSSVQNHPLDLTTSPGCSSRSPSGHCQAHCHPLSLYSCFPLGGWGNYIRLCRFG